MKTFEYDLENISLRSQVDLLNKMTLTVLKLAILIVISDLGFSQPKSMLVNVSESLNVLKSIWNKSKKT